MIGADLWRRLAGRGAGAGRCAAEGAAEAWRSWRPAAWQRPLGHSGVTAAPGPTAFGSGLTLFHDCPLAEIRLAQINEDFAPRAVAVSAKGFEGTYLSLVVDLPPDKARVLGERDIVCLRVRPGGDPMPGSLARLNLRAGPNVIVKTRSLRARGGGLVAEFDLGRLDLGGRRVSAVWIDLIFDAPLAEIRIADLCATRHRRAAF